MLTYVYCMPLWQIVFIIALLVVLWFYCGRKIDSRVWRVWNCIVMVVGIGVVLRATLLFREPTERLVAVIPFAGLSEALVTPGTEQFRSWLMNAFLFVSLGLSLPFLLPDKIPHKVILTVTLAALFSLTIECLQYRYSLGYCETDDVIMNTLGTLIGSISYMFYCKCDGATSK